MQGTNPAPLKAHPLSGCAKEPFRGGKPPTGRGFGTGFSHTVEFSRNVAGLLFGDSPAVPVAVTAGAAGTVPRAFQDRQRLPTCPASVLPVEHHPPRRRLHTEAPPCHPTFWASGRPPNSRRIESSWRSATSCLPVPARLASAGEVLGLEELPCLQPAEGSTGFDSVSTWCRLLEPSNHNGFGGLEDCNGRGRAGIPAVRTRAPGGGPGRGGRRSAGARRARRGARSGRSSPPGGHRAGPHPG
jgi:hypothetical protein